MNAYLLKYLEIKQLLIFAIYPIAYILFKASTFKNINLRLLKQLSVLFFVINLVIVFTPLSFVGELIDEFVFIIGLFLLFYLSLYFKKLKQRVGNIMVRIGQLLTLGLPIYFLCIILNPLYTSFSLDLSGLNPKDQTSFDDFRLVHYSKNSNFTYSGSHIIVIHKSLIPYFIEYRVGEANLGTFQSSDLSGNKTKITHYSKDGTSEEFMIQSPRFTIENMVLSKEEYDFETNSYEKVEKYNIE